MVRALKSLAQTDPKIGKVFDYVQQFSKEVADVPFMQGKVYEDVVMTGAADYTLYHQLGRPVVGWLVLRQNASSTIYDKQDSNATPETTLVLRPSNTVTVTLWVF